LPGDPVIRVTDYVRQCLLINDIRAILCEHPNEITLFTEESLTIWWVVALWSNLYFDFVPDLLEDQILKNTPASIEALTRLLWLSPDDRPNSAEINEPNAVTTFFKFPHNSLLGVEIHDSSISLQNYRATTYFCTAVVLWDFVPFKRTAAVAKKAVQLINDAKEIAQTMEKNDLSIYSFNRTLIEMVPFKEFVRQMEKSLQMIKDYIGRDLSTMDDREIIESDSSLSSMLMTLNF
jgi:hypothetical protein